MEPGPVRRRHPDRAAEYPRGGHGTFNETLSLNGAAQLETVEFISDHIDEFGTPAAYNHSSTTRPSRTWTPLLLAIVITVGLSVYVHGITARPLTERYTRWWHSHPRDARPAMESVAAAEHRWRAGGAGRITPSG